MDYDRYRYFIIKSVKNFSEHKCKNNRLKIPFCYREIVNMKVFHSVMKLMTFLTPNQNPSNVAVSQKSKRKSA